MTKHNDACKNIFLHIINNMTMVNNMIKHITDMFLSLNKLPNASIEQILKGFLKKAL